ncbi:cytosolic phospholipase A2 beta-like isoform X4 [Willisornis vidua]|uniref:Phospholipase A2 n=1 Tax=Willisornis vidua TaxID=1566151 RepID=A0ABQ9D2T2_9PASS|nr:cytosolic phospholipase A2 beta-like isoform X4 [Willisornis vidua]
MGSPPAKMKFCPLHMLSVRIIQAKNIKSKDLLTASDCYVRLWLPSASNGKLRTKTIKNSDNPVWNETFYFRIQREVENILELAVCDEDPLTKDDMQFTVLFNIARVRPGETIRETFALKSECEEQELLHALAQFQRFDVIGLSETWWEMNWEHHIAGTTWARRFLKNLVDKFMEQVLRETTRKDALDLLLVNRADLVSEVEIGGCLGQSDHEVIEFKISVGRRKSASKISTLDMRRADFRQLWELVSKVPRENVFAGAGVLQGWSLFKPHLLAGTGAGNSQMSEVKHAKQKAGLAVKESSHRILLDKMSSTQWINTSCDVAFAIFTLFYSCLLQSREVCCLEVQVDINESRKYLKEGKNLVLSVSASHEGTQKTTEDTDTFYFHCMKAWEPILKVRLQKVSDKEDDNSNLSDTLTVPLKFLPVGHKVKVTLPVRHNVPLQLYLQLNDCTGKLDVRLGYDLCQEEQQFLQKRKRVVANALKRVLHLKRDLHGHEVPVIAVMATGGGLRAMSAMFGHLLALQKLNLLDCVTYLTGASGSTWTLADLYEHADWSQKSLEGPLKAVKEKVTKCKLDLMSIDHLKYYHKELTERAKAGHVSSFTTLWSLVQEMFLHERPRKYKLTDQRRALEHGQNPLPFYAVLNVKDEKFGTFKFRVNMPYVNSFVEWADFSPYEVTIPKYGVSIPSEYFDSKFFMGRRVRKMPESRICYLEGLWTNIFTRNLLDGLYWSSNSNEFWERWAQDMVDIEKHSPEDDITVIEPPSCLSGKLYEMFQDIMSKRPLLGKSHNFLRGLEFHKDYIHQKKFIEWKDTILDAFPNNLTPLQKYLCLIDVGYFINTSGAALFKPERNVDVIISLDYGLGNVFKQLEMTYKYCKIQKIPFPKVELSEEEMKNPKECYIFSDAEDPRAPIVIHFPLVNDTFKEFKEPGVKRGHSEMEEGKVNLENNCSPYYLIRLIYSSENFDKLVNLSKYNILNNKDLLLQAIRSAVERRRSSRTGNVSSYSGYP